MTEVPSAAIDTALGAKLPPSWTLTTLGAVTDYGKTEKVEPSEIPNEAWVLELEDIQKDSSRVLQRLTQLERQSRSTKNRFDAGDVLYGKLRPYLNKVIIADTHGFCTTEIVPVRAGPALDRRYLFHWLKHPVFLKYVETASHGMNMPRLGTDAGRAAPLVLAPRPEQARIADRLDTLLARIQACRDHLEAIPALLRRLRTAAFDAAVTGRISEAWRNSRTRTEAEIDIPLWAAVMGLRPLPPGWRWARFAELLASLRSGTSAVPGDDETQYPVLRSSSVRPMDADLGDVRYLDSLHKVRAEDLLADDDLLFTRLSGSLDYVANCAVVRGLGESKIYYPDRLFRARLKDPRLGPYVELCFASPLLRQHLTVESRSTAGHQRISMSAIRDFPIPLPREDERLVIAEKIGGLLKFADRIEASLNGAVARAQSFEPLTLLIAFRGDLVPQDPNDEPASALLERIGAQRGGPAPANRTSSPRSGRPPRAPKEIASMTKSRQDADVMGKPYLAGHLLRIGRPTSAEALFKAAELPVADFYKQLAWEVAQGHVKDNHVTLEPGHAAG